MTPRRLLRIAALLGGAMVAAAHGAAGQNAGPAQALEVQFIDAGQADAILIKSGHLGVLIDASRGDDIVQVLAEQGIDSLAAAIASHNHDDHIGGMDAVLSDYKVGEYLFNGRPPENYNADNVNYWLVKRHVTAPDPPWQPIQLGDTRITVFPSPLDPGVATENTSSLGVLIERGKFKALLTGDSELDELNGWMKQGIIPDVDVLKAAHHGARNGVTPGWIHVTRPEVVVISVGANNSYGHPDSLALRYYSLHHAKVLRTDRDGTVIVSVDSTGAYQVRTLGPSER